MRNILLNPGPVTLSDGVRGALTRADLCHREDEFATLQSGLREKLLRVYDLPADEWAAILLTGSGTAAVEAMLASCVPQDGRLLIIENGVYGERMQRIAEAYAMAHQSVRCAWIEAIELTEIRALLAGGNFSHVAVVHHETTTGRLNNLRALGEICAMTNTRMLVDAVSSFGAESIDFSQWPIDACAATANKCLHGVPGTAFVVARRNVFDQPHEKPRSVYLNLAEYLAKQDAGGTPFTQSVQTFYALDEALNEFFAAGGVIARQRLFQGRMAQIRTALERLGVVGLLPVQDCSCVLQAFELPEGMAYDNLHDQMKRRGFIIYAGQGSLAVSAFMISAMGDINTGDMNRLLDALQEILA